MTRLTHAIVGAAVVLALWGCWGERDTLLSPAGASAEAQGPGLCVDSPWLCVPVDGTIHDGTGDGILPVFPDDPSPGADGLWLGDMTSARYCYADYNSFITDQDHDWLDDDCEFRLASAFAPALVISPLDGCPSGEPYWAAKYFPNDPSYGWGEFVRIAYLPSYYRDCGQGGIFGIGIGHRGDSEFIMIAVQYNTSTQHWEVRGGMDSYLSAHAFSDYDRSTRPTRDQFYYPTRRYAYPQVWVSRAKHANYRSQGACENWASFDFCSDNVKVGRIRVYPNRNIGSRWVDFFPNGAMSENALYRDEFNVEYFYGLRTFRGWQMIDDQVTPYSVLLITDRFECYKFGTGGDCYWGEGPNAPLWTHLTGVIHGPTQVTQGQSYTWTSFVTGGQLPYSAQWWRKYASEPSFTQVGTSNNGSSPFTAGSWTSSPNRCENFTLKMKITSADSQEYWSWTISVAVSCPPPPQPVSVSIFRDGYYFTAMASGGQQPYAFLWEACAIDCDGNGPALAAPAQGGIGPNTVVHGWNTISTAQTIYYTYRQRTLRSTVTDAGGQQAVATYYIP